MRGFCLEVANILAPAIRFMSKNKKLLPAPALGRYLFWKTSQALKKKGVPYLAAVPVLSIFLLNSPAIDTVRNFISNEVAFSLIKEKVGSFVLAQTESPQDQLAQKDGPSALLITKENSLLASSHVLPQEEVITRRINVVITAYSSQEWQTDDSPFITANGTYVREGIVANNLLPFGTKIRIPEIFSQKIFVVEDRLHSKKGLYHIDIWLPSLQEAVAFGAKYTYIEVVD